jgi:prephenate dehydrogenase
MTMKTTVIGLGLIGGSLALDLRRLGLTQSITGVDADPDNAVLATDLGLVDVVVPLEDAVRNADLIIVTIPVTAIAMVLPKVLDFMQPEAVVIDSGSTKSSICKAVASHPRRNRFVASHPIAGTENSGPRAAFNGLFAGKTNIICERAKSSADALSLAGRIFNALAMNTIFMEPEEHDKHVAYVSHLSHVSSFLLGQTVLDIERDEKNIFAPVMPCASCSTAASTGSSRSHVGRSAARPTRSKTC